VECNQEAIDEIKNSFKFNDSIIRNIVLSTKKAHSEPSALLAQTKEDNEKDSYQEAREAANNAVDQEAKAASNKTEKPKEMSSKLDESSTEESKEEE
jgi:hypothetical protein